VKRKRAFFLLAGLILCLKVSGYEEKISLGGEEGWSRLVVLDDIVLRRGHEGNNDLSLREGEYDRDESSSPGRELILHFNGPEETDPGPGYRWAPETALRFSSREKALGQGALAFERPDEPAILRAGRGGPLGPGTAVEDFTLEFWVYPARLAEGEEVFRWEGVYRGINGVLPQAIICRIEGQKLTWHFDNFFLSTEETPREFLLRGNVRLFPRKWQHHLIRYQGATGILEYLLNGVPEALVHTTPTGRAGGEILQPRPGGYDNPGAGEGFNRILLGANFIGLVDELRLVPRYVEEPQLERYHRSSGTVITGILDLGQKQNRLIRLEARQETPENTALYYFYRLSDDYFLPDDEELPWQIAAPESPINRRGRYLQLLIQFLPDGTGFFSPQISSLDIYYEPSFPPLAPSYLTAQAQDGAVLLIWDSLSGQGALEYQVFFGDRPGYYFGTSAQGNSPVSAGRQTQLRIEGLENGKLYYFAVTALSEQGLRSEFSGEVSARPSHLYRNSP
jgi:hypothetical protein